MTLQCHGSLSPICKDPHTHSSLSGMGGPSRMQVDDACPWKSRERATSSRLDSGGAWGLGSSWVSVVQAQEG